ncbi:glycosyltransferase family 4 protein [Desulfobulbus alkaliphilus]|uniref:glycosyltransferase family 4 protein n=1 Tax=Desulfobulbus alkaliphilus TaxID=869814 RepID=UPI0019647537|nr:glycosyltransferase family 4 protein [Desulfobulbus alkaliphilus]MBM9538198.1 glycosyltransferase family 4 protein [Desulfobulbus alkaliphilus]
MGNPMRKIAREVLKAYADHWPVYSRLIPVHDIKTWSIKWDMQELLTIAKALRIKTAHPFWQPFATHQAVFLGSQFFLLSDHWFSTPNRIGTAYFHGKPGTGYPEFDQLYKKIQQNHQKIDRIQVSHSEMHEVILETGIAPEKVFRIPIGINLDFFPLKKQETRQKVRSQLKIPEAAVVIGSFQKDGNGHGEGLEPKAIKGPDIFLKTVQRLKNSVPELHILLTGPARGYMKRGLTDLNIPFTHVHLKNYPEISRIYHALDMYMVTSRQEGGPKAILESMASGVPLVTTRVGQAMDLVQHGLNGWMVPVEDVDALAYWAEWVLKNPSTVALTVNQARKTAEQNSYRQLIDKWGLLLNGFVQSTPHN